MQWPQGRACVHLVASGLASDLFESCSSSWLEVCGGDGWSQFSVPSTVFPASSCAYLCGAPVVEVTVDSVLACLQSPPGEVPLP